MTAARPKARMSARRYPTPLMEPYSSAWPPSDLLSRPLVKKFVNPPRRFGTDAFDLHQVGDRGTLDGFQRAEVVQQRALARRPDAGDLLQARLAHVARPARPVRADGEAMGLVAQPLDEIEHRVARRQLERVAPREEEGFAAGVAIRPLGDGGQGHLGAQLGEHFAGGIELAEAAVDQHQVRPRRFLALVFPPPLRGREQCDRSLDRSREWISTLDAVGIKLAKRGRVRVRESLR